jgi:hypothetical protein
MTGLKYYERTNFLIELIEKRKTGSPRELAGKLGLKERMICALLLEKRYVTVKKKNLTFFQKKVNDCKEIALKCTEMH